jgi:glyoxylase-like metal-dependent hydrolase (beta-lactamase superfamily II)
MIKRISFFLISVTFILSGFAGVPDTGAVSGYTPAVDELQDLFKASLGKNEVAFISLPFSGVLFRVEDVTILIDPANLLSDEDIESLKEAGLDLLLYTHGHGEHLHLPTAKKIHESCQLEMAVDPSLDERIKRTVPTGKLIGAEPGQSYTIGKAILEAVKGEHIGPITLFKITVGDI